MSQNCKKGKTYEFQPKTMKMPHRKPGAFSRKPRNKTS